MDRTPEANGAAGGELGTFGDALWWTAMLVTTLGSDYWPRTAEGRVLCLILSLYAIGVSGYVAATLASFFIGRRPADTAQNNADVRALHDEVAALRGELCAMRNT